MRLFIAEKPSVAKAIIAELGTAARKDGYVETKTGDLVSWCFGHLMELAEPDDYLGDDVPKSKNGSKVWRDEDLPILPQKWLNRVKPDCKKQFKVIGQLLKRCDQVVGAGDPDREGQLLIDEVLEFYGNKKPVLRFWVSAQDSESIRAGLKNLQPNAKFRGMFLAARGRQHADWLLGINLSRAYTLAVRRGGGNAVLSVGRVQTPTLNLVAQRDLAIENFKAVPFFVISGNFNSASPFSATLQPPAGMKGFDADGRLIDAAVAKTILAQVQNCQNAKVLSFENKNKNVDQPKAMSLADMQQFASNKWGFSAQKTLDICQSLYETHKLTSYPRTDCQFLPESQHLEAAKVMAALAVVDPNLKPLLDGADLSIKSKTWNDKKITAHHGLIPTMNRGDLSKLSADELKIWNTIVRRYIAQFYPPCVMATVSVSLDVNGLIFTASGSTMMKAGFKTVVTDTDNTDDDTKEPEQKQKIPPLQQGATVDCLKFAARQEKTKPPASFTEGSLIRAMENIYTVVDDPAFKKFLKDGDGIGTSATRAAIIDELKKRGFLELSGKKIKATPLAFKFLSVLPDVVKNPVLTALFESKLKEVEAGKMQLTAFEQEQCQFVTQQVAKAQAMTIDASGMCRQRPSPKAKKQRH